MEYPRIALGRTGLELLPLGVGCWAWGDEPYWGFGGDFGAREVVDAFTASVEAGLDLFDTAEVYGHGKSEQLLGALARRSPRPVLVATKYAPLTGRGGPAAIPRALSKSLKRLGLPRVDLYQVHWADRDEAPIAETMRVLADLAASGQTRAVGVSNFTAAEMREAHAALARRGVPLACNQVRYSLLDRSPETNGVLDACRELDVALLAYSPLAQGVLTGKYGPDARPRGRRGEADCFAPDTLAAAQPLIAKLRDIGTAHGVAPEAIALAWLLGQPAVIPIPGAKTGEQARRNAAALGVRLTDAERADIDAVSERWRR